MNRHIKTEDKQIANKHMEGCSTWGIDRELQTKPHWDASLQLLQWLTSNASEDGEK